MEIHPFVLLLTFIVLLPDVVTGHGRLIEPASRNAMWRYKYNNPRNYNDMGLNCGGFTTQFEKYGGKCGVCGDPWAGEREHEAGGKYANGVIARQYKVGSFINVTVTLTSNHMGYFEFRLCPVNNPRVKVTQACLDQHLLNIVGHGTRYFIMDKRGYVNIYLFVMLPPKMKCSQCVFQWKYVAGQSMGPDGRGGECLGCGNQEHFVNCADIAIGNHVIAPLPQALTTPSPSAAMPTQMPTNLNVLSVDLHSHGGHQHHQHVHSYGSYNHATPPSTANHHVPPNIQRRPVQAPAYTTVAPYIAPKVTNPPQVNNQWGGSVKGWQNGQSQPQMSYKGSRGVPANAYPQAPQAPQYPQPNRHVHQSPTHHQQNIHVPQPQSYPQQSNILPHQPMYPPQNNPLRQTKAYPPQNIPQTQNYPQGQVSQIQAYQRLPNHVQQMQNYPRPSGQSHVHRHPQPHSRVPQPQAYPQPNIQPPQAPIYSQPNNNVPQTYTFTQQKSQMPQAPQVPTYQQPNPQLPANKMLRATQTANTQTTNIANLKPELLKMFPNFLEGFDWLSEMTQTNNNNQHQDPSQRSYPGYEPGEYPEPGETVPTSSPSQGYKNSRGSSYMQGYQDAMRELKNKFGINIPQGGGGSANGAGSWKPGATCKGIDPAKGSSMDTWCTLNCKGGHCPPELCACL